MGKVKYNEEMKLQTVKYVLEGGKSATKVAKEFGIDTRKYTVNEELSSQLETKLILAILAFQP